MQIASRHIHWNAPLPSATRLTVRAEPAAMTVRIAGGFLAPGSTGATVRWGDGTVTRYPWPKNLSHTYARPGEYTVEISDDLESFAFAAYDWTAAERGALAEFLTCGDKVGRIDVYGFNCCGRMRGKISLSNVTEVDSYAFGSCGRITDIELPSVSILQPTPFYYGCTATALYADGATVVGGSFFDYYGPNLVDLYLRSLTCSQIRRMGGFPFRAGGHVRFHGSDGVIDRDGRNV